MSIRKTDMDILRGSVKRFWSRHETQTENPRTTTDDFEKLTAKPKENNVSRDTWAKAFEA